MERKERNYGLIKSKFRLYVQLLKPINTKAYNIYNNFFTVRHHLQTYLYCNKKYTKSRHQNIFYFVALRLFNNIPTINITINQYDFLFFFCHNSLKNQTK